MSIKELLYDWGGLNLSLFHAINQFHGVWYDSIMLVGSALSNRYDFPLYLILIGLVTVHRKNYLTTNMKAQWQFVMIFAVAFVLDTALVEALKILAHYPRPFVTLPPDTMRIIGEPLDRKEYYYSFPSGHASFATLIIGSIWAFMNRYGKTLGCLFVLWAGWSRIALGAHYPADVLAGIIIGLIAVWGARLLYYKSVIADKAALRRSVF